MRTSIAIYFDLENVDKKLNLKKLLEAVTLDIEDDSTPVFAIFAKHLRFLRETVKIGLI